MGYWRHGPLLESSQGTITERFCIEYIESCNIYGFMTTNGIALKINDPSRLMIDGRELIEVPRNIEPLQGQYRVDYSAYGYYGTGIVQVHASLIGKIANFEYYPYGPIGRLTSNIDLSEKRICQYCRTMQDSDICTQCGAPQYFGVKKGQLRVAI